MSALRTVGTGIGLVVAVGVLAGRAALAPVARRAVLKARDEVPAAEPAIPSSSNGRVRRVRLALAGAGLIVLLVGMWKVLHAVQPASYVWLVLWLLGAILLNDVVIAPVVGLLRALAHRVLQPGRGATLALVKGGFVVAGVLVLVVAPEIWAQHLGPANPTILPSDYSRRLAVVVAVVAALTLVTALGASVRGRYRAQRGRGPT